jgi:hypothetical protein
MRYFTDGPIYELQKPTVAGRKDPNENNLAGLFLERVFAIAGENSYVAQVLPGVIFNGSFSKDLRLKLLDNAEISALIGFENHGIFDGIENRYNFAVTAFKNSGRTDVLRGIFQQRDVAVLDEWREQAVEIPREVSTEYSPEARIFPFIRSHKESEALSAILSYPSLGDGIPDRWNVIPHRELDRTRDADRFVEDEQVGSFSVYSGKNVHQHVYDDTPEVGAQPFTFWSVEEDVAPAQSAKRRTRERTFNSGDLKKAIYRAFGEPETSKSQKQSIDGLLIEHRGELLRLNDVLLDCTEYRVAYRDIARAFDERTMIAAVLPSEVVHRNKLHSLRPYDIRPTESHLAEDPIHGAYKRIFSDEELFVASGLTNSLPFDFLIRTKVDSTVVTYKFTESQVPRLTAGDDWFDYVWRRAARLNCYGEVFAEMRDRLGGLEPAIDTDERRRLRAETDAAAFHAYGLDRKQTKFVLDDFHRIQNPQVMDEDYFDSVLKFYDQLAESGPRS